ncbi:MAG: hypothetical protein ABWY58_09615 [Aeromicrobium sp.]
MSVLNKKRGSLVAAAVAAVLATVPGTSAGAVSPDPGSAGSASSANVAMLPPGGTWVAYEPDATSSKTAAAAGLVRPVEHACPAGTTNYPAAKRAFNCLSTYHDNGNKGHSVGLRQGRTGSSAFGYLHALQDHGLDEQSIGTVIVNNAAGISQGNSRYLYGLRYEVNDVGILAVEVIEDRKPSAASPDDYKLGVVTAYCKGYDQCPPGVNESLP